MIPWWILNLMRQIIQTFLKLRWGDLVESLCINLQCWNFVILWISYLWNFCPIIIPNESLWATWNGKCKVLYFWQRNLIVNLQLNSFLCVFLTSSQLSTIKLAYFCHLYNNVLRSMSIVIRIHLWIVWKGMNKRIFFYRNQEVEPVLKVS